MKKYKQNIRQRNKMLELIENREKRRLILETMDLLALIMVLGNLIQINNPLKNNLRILILKWRKMIFSRVSMKSQKIKRVSISTSILIIKTLQFKYHNKNSSNKTHCLLVLIYLTYLEKVLPQVKPLFNKYNNLDLKILFLNKKMP